MTEAAITTFSAFSSRICLANEQNSACPPSSGSTGSKLKKVSIRYSGESTGFCERTFEKMLKYYYDQGIPCKVEYYRKIGMMSSMMIWFEVPGNIFVVLEHLIIQSSESKISSVFIHACNSQYYSKANIVKGYKRTD